MPRMLRTYSRRGGYLRALPQPDRWISPPQDRRRLFSSSSAASSALSSALSSAPSATSDDPDFSPPRKRRQKPLGERPARPRYLRSRRGAEKENRAPAALSSPSPSPLPRRPRRRRKGSPSASRRPLLCSTPHWAPPGGAARPPRSPAAPLPELSTSVEGGSALQCSPELFSSHDASLGSAANSPGTPRGGSERLPLSPRGRSGRDGATGAPREAAPGESSAPGLRSQTARRVPRASVREPPHGAAAVAPLDGEPRRSAVRGAAGSEGPRGDAKGDATAGSPGRHGGAAERRLMPVVVLDRGEVPLWLSGRKAASPPGRRGAAKYQRKSTKLIPGEGSTCRKACISGFSASRWGRQPRLRPHRHKNKRQQQAGSSFLRPPLRRRARRKGVQMSAGTQDAECSFLNNSHHWGRFRASLSFHKRKKVVSDDSSYASILCNPFVNSQLSGHQATLSSSKAESYALSASSVILLAPMSSSSVLEVTLTDAEKVFRECQQEGPITFEDCIPLDKMKDCKKIGEGVFGEVFQVDSERGPVALKIIPIEGTERVNGEAQKSFGEILPEIIISKELSLLSEESMNRTVGFISLYSVHCVQGAYPKYLLKAWDTYNKVTGSENDRPDLFGEEQLFMVLEFEFGGSDLENMRKKLSTVASAKSILHQVTASLAVAEQELHFEHRDLHWGNVLVKKTDAKELNYVLNGSTCTIPTAGIHVNIIDYTLSRLEKDGLTVFCDLSTDEELFQGTGDYQFDIYRQMKMENSNSWTDYHPHSNVLWLHYLSDKLLKDVVYKKKESSSAMRKIKQQLTKFHKEVLTFGSASEVLDRSSLFQ
ncbi:serine/threonine-protein kinase haspin [Gallus gallus]|uniref:serine/threonine-protein kinase haspin n=1 Tax=Gallus gallus TaxID=9031 RepID=UPI001AE6EBE5|nr:serine/threonine-protein kinase haspin [Gallus gallus]XP_425408.3 serine/threonine-protein kinase haspin [Gallus gallus]